MFTPDNVIDTIQTTKKQYITTYVTNKVVADALNQFVDTQTEYTKRDRKSTRLNSSH